MREKEEGGPDLKTRALVEDRSRMNDLMRRSALSPLQSLYIRANRHLWFAFT